jgi:hypothetical protein
MNMNNILPPSMTGSGNRTQFSDQIKTFGNNVQKQTENVMRNVENFAKAVPAAKEKFLEIYGTTLRTDLRLSTNGSPLYKDSSGKELWGLYVFDATGKEIINIIDPDGSIRKPEKQTPNSSLSPNLSDSYERGLI